MKIGIVKFKVIIIAILLIILQSEVVLAEKEELTQLKSKTIEEILEYNMEAEKNMLEISEQKLGNMNSTFQLLISAISVVIAVGTVGIPIVSKWSQSKTIDKLNEKLANSECEFNKYKVSVDEDVKKFDTRINLQKVILLLSENRLYEAKLLIDDILDKNHKDVMVNIIAGDVYYELGNYNEALIFYKNIPDENVEKYICLSKTNNKLRYYKKSLKIIDEGLDEYPNNKYLEYLKKSTTIMIRENCENV